MPIYEYECYKCDNRIEIFSTTIKSGQKINNLPCVKCDGVLRRIISLSKFRVTGFSAKNGYNLPNYDDVINADGHAKERWGKKY